MIEATVAIRGGGDLGSGVALRLWRAGFRVVILECSAPLAVRRTVAFSESVYDGRATVENATGVLVSSLDSVQNVWAAGDVPVVVDPGAVTVSQLRPFTVVDAIMAKRNTGTTPTMAPVAIGLGPGFYAGRDVTAVVETNRGPDLGRVIWQGAAQPNTGVPGAIADETIARVLRSPGAGSFTARRAITDRVRAGDVIATVGDLLIVAGLDGIVRGLLRNGASVQTGMKVGDIDPRNDVSLCWRVSDKSLAVAGGVLEALLARLREGT